MKLDYIALAVAITQTPTQYTKHTQNNTFGIQHGILIQEARITFQAVLSVCAAPLLSTLPFQLRSQTFRAHAGRHMCDAYHL